MCSDENKTGAAREAGAGPETKKKREIKPNVVDEEYRALVYDILDNGVERNDRTGAGTLSLFGTRMKIDIRDKFPLLTCKEMYFKGVFHELLWFLQGSTNIRYLTERKTHIWDGDAYRWYKTLAGRHGVEPLAMEAFLAAVEDEDSSPIPGYAYGDLGDVYGKQWRRWGKDGTDQIGAAMELLKNDPDSRRIMVTAWDPDALPESALPPCHVLFQFYTREIDTDRRWEVFHKTHPQIMVLQDKPEMLDEYLIPTRELSLQWYQRSVDVGLGLPFNIASYALLTYMMAQAANMVPGDLIFVGGDTHVYKNHAEPLRKFFERDAYDTYDSPTLELNPLVKWIDDFTFNDITLMDYFPCGRLKLPLNVG